MKKAKRISLIAKGKGFISDLLSIGERKITRAIDAAIDITEENAICAKEAALKAIEAMSESDDPEALNECINAFFDKKCEEEQYNQRHIWAKELKALLNEEVIIPEKEE